MGLDCEHLKTAWNFGKLLNKRKTLVMLNFRMTITVVGWIEGFLKNGRAIFRDLFRDKSDYLFCNSCR